jgi:hypothetical protein
MKYLWDFSGSSFSKAKPKQGFMTVTKLATLRCLFLPLYSKWWMQQTSVSIFILMFCLYISQLMNIAIYYENSWNYDALDKSTEVIVSFFSFNQYFIRKFLFC